MFEDKNLGAAILRNPGSIQYLALQVIAERAATVVGDTVEIPDPNSAVNNLLDYGAGLTAQMVRQENDSFSSIFRKRVRTAEDVYSFLSDYDYPKVAASPAMVQLRLVLSKKWIIDNAVSYDDNYNKIQIPATTVFTIGAHTFGMYYPIDFLVSKTTGGLTILYNTDTPNPLLTLQTVELTDVNIYTQGGLDLVSLIFPIYQFSVRPETETISSTVGWSKTYVYADQFYSVRIFAYVNGVRTEIPYTLSSFDYDPNTPTALLSVLSDVNSIKVEIPQVYFTRGMIGTSLEIEIYTTEGLLNVAITETDAQATSVEFDQSASAYSAMWTQLPVIAIMPYTDTIDGGTDAMTFDQIKSLVSQNQLYDDDIVTRLDLQTAMAKLGFTAKRYVDSLDRRTYFADATLKGSDNYTIPCAYAPVVFSSSSLGGDPSSILKFTDNTYTVLPTTLFSFDTLTNTAVPISDSAASSIGALPRQDLADLLNSTIYGRQPFHLVLDTSQKYPSARAYNLMNPVMNSLNFIYEDAHSASQFSASSIQVSHLANGTGGYQIIIGAAKDPSMDQVDSSTLKILLVGTLKTGTRVYLEAAYTATSGTIDIFTATLLPTYHLTSDGYFSTALYGLDGVVVDGDMTLTASFDLLMLIPQSLESITQDATLAALLPNSYASSYFAVAQQRASITFGEDLSTQILNSVNTTWGLATNATYQQDVYATWAGDEFLRNSSGLYYVYDTGKELLLIKKASKGDAVLTGMPTAVTFSTAASAGAMGIRITSTAAILDGSTITFSDKTTATIKLAADGSYTLSTPLATAQAVGAIAVVQSTVITDRTVASASTVATSITMSDISDIVVGMTVHTYGYDGVITAIDSVNKVLTLTTTSTNLPMAGAPLYIAWTGGPANKIHSVGDIIYDASGSPVQKTQRSNVYTVSMIMFDAKLYASEATADVSFVSSLGKTVSDTAHTLDTLRASIGGTLGETLDLYFRPYRTIGTADFDVGDGQTQTMNLDQSYAVSYLVPSAVKQNTDLTTLITNSTAQTVSDYLGRGIVSSDAISKQLNLLFATSIQSASVSGIDETDIRAASVVTDGVTPSLGRELVVGEDGLLKLMPTIGVTFKTAPSETS